MKNRAIRLLSAFTLAAFSFQNWAAPASAAAKPDPALGAPARVADLEAAYPVGAGDVVSINVFPVEEYSRELTVQPDGKIELPLIGAVQVKGLTGREIQAMLESGFSRFVANPKVTVNVRRFAGRRVAIIGEVGAPGYYEYRDEMSLLELVSTAGGPKSLAKPSKTVILRQEKDGPGAYKVNLAAVLRGEAGRNVQLQPGDVVYIPKAAYTQGAEWLTVNILPWISVAALVTSIVVVARQ
ncbi:MAG: polysaccharide biosynthesis/export family protein [Elusimicrobia bacterium]|nr:polysaccharide biosynthesis/export family protein [Elusimicrobiota bacterium]